MNKRKLHHKLVTLRHFPKLLLLGLTVFFAITSVFALRANNQKMLELREAVFVADEQDGDIEAALSELREHVHSHMNTNLSAGENAIKPPIQLKYEYERLVEAEKQKLNSTNSNLYTQAQDYCEPRFPAGALRSGRVGCIQDYIDKHGQKVEDFQAIDESLYKFDFVSPSWSPDLAGWSIALAIICLVALLGLVIVEIVIKLMLS